MKVVFAIDALEHKLVEEFETENLKQKYYGRTNISEFSEPRTMVLWSSFMTGENKETEVLELGDKAMWDKKWGIEDTFFSEFENPKILDLPGFSYDLEAHKKSRELLKSFFESEDSEDKKQIKKEYNQDAFEHHKKVKKQFLNSLDKDHDFVLGYFSVADVIGHLNFGNKTMMKMIYTDLDEIADELKNREKITDLIVLSDHGMKAIGNFGDHSTYGFWSTNFKDLNTPKITDFSEIIKNRI
ncbi:MAG: alkaline phosphatase family protein [Candidatus Undinarchaeales archaeon]